MRYFNAEGLCTPEEHCMVKIEARLEQIKRLLAADCRNDNRI